MQKHIGRKAAKLVNAPLRAKPEPRKEKAPIAPAKARPDKFTYALAQWSVELRPAGWFVSKTTPSFADGKPEWSGPFQTIENACLAIARRHATEIADRHTRSIEFHNIKRGDPLYGLKPETRLT